MRKPINEVERLKLIAGLINEVEYNDSVYGVNRKALTEAKKKEVKEASIDVVNPYQYSMGIQYELEKMDDYSNEALEKAKSIVLKNLAKDQTYYTTLLYQDESSYEFKPTETDAKGMQANADGHLKKEAKKDEKANVQDSLGKKEAGKKKPKGVKIMPDKGVTGSEKTIKEGIEGKFDNDDNTYTYDHLIKTDSPNKEQLKKVLDTIKKDKEELAKQGKKTKVVKGDTVPYLELDETVKEGLEEAKINKYLTQEKDEEGETYITPNEKAIADYLKSVIDPEEIESVDIFMFDDSEGWEETVLNGNIEWENMSENDIEELAKQEMSYYLFSKPDEFPGKEMNEHHNDPTFPGGSKIHAMLDKVADEWGKDSDVYNDLEDAIVGWSDRNGELTPKGKIAIRALLSNWDILDDYEEFLGDTMEEGSFMGGVDLGSSSNINAEDEFNQLMSKYDWYYEMSDDPRAYTRGLALDRELRDLGKQIGADKAVNLFNAKAPSDRKVTNTFFMEGEDKHAKLKEILKKKVKEAIYKKQGAGGKDDVVVASSPKSTSELTKRGYIKVPGTEDATGLKQ